MSIMTGEPPVISYRRTEEPGEEPPAEMKPETPFSKAANHILTGLTWVILGIVLGVWAVMGMLFWIPLLLRAMLRFSLSLLEAVFEGQRPTDSARILRDAVSFYRRGFVVAVEAVTKEEIEEEYENTHRWEPSHDGGVLGGSGLVLHLPLVGVGADVSLRHVELVRGAPLG